MKRPLLPYEHQLVEALGVTKEEYLDFLMATRDFEQSPEQKLEQPQNTVAVAALVLTIVGMIFQVAAALLAPKPEEQNQRRAREQRFSPRYGFNSSQELAQYGQPVNLVYCSKANPRGSVRVATSLVWSAVDSYGSSQFMQLLLLVGAAKVKTIDFDRVAFGQLPLGQFSGANTWLYYNEDGRVVYNDKVLGDGKDPTRDGSPSSADVCQLRDGDKRLSGYSQAFTPSSLTTIGIYDPIPVNVDIQERRTSGTPDWASLGIRIKGESWQSGGDVRYKKGDTLTIVFEKAFKRQDKVAQEAAKNLRYQMVSSLDQAAVYMLGSAKFKLVSVTDETNLDKNEVEAKFECVEAGRRPSAPYDETKAKSWDDDDRLKLEAARDVLKAPATDAQATGPSIADDAPKSAAVPDALRRITDNGYYGNTTEQTGDVSFNFLGKKYSFTGTETIKWTDELDKKQSYVVTRSGSIASSRKELDRFLAEKPRLSVAALRKELDDDLEKVRQLRDDVLAGDYDKDLRKEAKKNEAVQAVKQDIERLKEELERRIVQVYKLNPKTVTISGNKVLTDGTKLDVSGKKIAELEKQIERRREEKDDLLSDNIAARRKAYSQFLRRTTGSFVGLDGNRYGTGGIVAIKRRIADLKGESTSDAIGVDAVKGYMLSLIQEKEEALNFLDYGLKNWEDLQGAADDNFYTKCLVKADSAAYQTITACDYVKFSLRCKLFRRIQGRQKKYGEKDAPEGYKMSDNGIQGRIGFFKVSYRVTGESNYTSIPIVFAVRRAADQDSFIGLDFKAPSKSKWEFKIEPIGDIGAETLDNGQQQFAFIENSGKRSSYALGDSGRIKWTGSLVDAGLLNKGALEERGPIYTNEWDLFSVRSDTSTQFSFEGGPEFKITAVTEQQEGSVGGKYDSMSMMALGVYSGKGVQDLRSITAFVKEGKESWVVNEASGARTLSSESTSYAPDIFTDTVLDVENGIGKYAKPEGINWDMLALSKRFCKNNGLGCQLFMDGVIADLSSWRQFWAEAAPYSLLEMAKIGGRETLIPAVPTNKNGVANREVTVSAMFTAGNILEGSYKEEFVDYGDSSQDLIATVIYRDTEVQDVFPRNASVQVSLADVREATAIRQTFDLSQFVTQREQAILFGKLLCNQRRWMRRGVEFQTFPTDSPIAPGDYIYVDIGLNTWDRVSSGMVMEGGKLNIPLKSSITNGQYSVLLYKAGEKVKSFSGVTVATNGTTGEVTASALTGYKGAMFVLGIKSNKKRVFRVTEVAMDEEGEVTVKAMEHPCEESGSKLLSRVANFAPSLFRVEADNTGVETVLEPPVEPPIEPPVEPEESYWDSWAIQNYTWNAESYPVWWAG